jgi:tetratricopeptide (TPR) repeat protein
VARRRVRSHLCTPQARATGRKDLIARAAKGLSSSYLWQDELDPAEELAGEALRLAEKSGGILPRGHALRILATIAYLRGDSDPAVELYEESIRLFAEAGKVLDHASSLNHLAEIVMNQGDDERAEHLARKAIRMLTPLGDRGYLCESQRVLAEILLHQGNLEDAERYALEALRTVGAQDVSSLPTTRAALGLVRAAQGRGEEAETLLREAVDQASDLVPRWILATSVKHLAAFLRARGRTDEAAELDALPETPAAVG